MPSVESFEVITEDDLPLAARIFRPDPASIPIGVVIINSGAGIPQSFYRQFAFGLVETGLAVFTYDYRGIAESRPAGPLRGFRASVEDWGSKDCAALLRTAGTLFPGQPVAIVGHSIGMFVTGFVKESAPIAALVSIGGHTGYWRDYSQPYRYPMGLLWHVLMPAITRVVGYFPGRAFGLPADIPRQVALEWAGRLKPDFGWNLVTPDGRHDTARAEALRSRFAALRAPSLAVRIVGDAFASQTAYDRLKELFPRCSWTQFVILPREYGAGPAGHFAYFRKDMRSLWSVIANWLAGELVRRSEL